MRTNTEELPESDALKAAGQKWRGDDGAVIIGPQLAKRLYDFGVIGSAVELTYFAVGECIKTGVSAYERIE